MANRGKGVLVGLTEVLVVSSDVDEALTLAETGAPVGIKARTLNKTSIFFINVDLLKSCLYYIIWHGFWCQSLLYF